MEGRSQAVVTSKACWDSSHAIAFLAVSSSPKPVMERQPKCLPKNPHLFPIEPARIQEIFSFQLGNETLDCSFPNFVCSHVSFTFLRNYDPVEYHCLLPLVSLCSFDQLQSINKPFFRAWFKKGWTLKVRMACGYGKRINTSITNILIYLFADVLV